MAEFQWWLLIVGIVAGGALVAVVFLDGSRRDADIPDDERRAESTWIAEWLEGEGRTIEPEDVEAVLRIHREYLSLPPPDRLEPVDSIRSRTARWDTIDVSDRAETSAHADADRDTDEVGHDGRGSSDQDLASA